MIESDSVSGQTDNSVKSEIKFNLLAARTQPQLLDGLACPHFSCCCFS